MKNIIKYLLCVCLFWGCSSEDSDEESSVLEPNFKFEISGAVNATLTGQGVVYNETTVETKDYEGKDVKVTTILVIAQDRDSDNQVIFGVTRKGSKVGTGDYEIGTDLFEFHNAFMNFSGDRGSTISYQSESGSINFDSRLVYATGQVNVTCSGVGGGETLTVKGSFQAESVK